MQSCTLMHALQSGNVMALLKGYALFLTIIIGIMDPNVQTCKLVCKVCRLAFAYAMPSTASILHNYNKLK
jgi:hypothetical protein